MLKNDVSRFSLEMFSPLSAVMGQLSFRSCYLRLMEVLVIVKDIQVFRSIDLCNTRSGRQNQGVLNSMLCDG